jgi:hypothetical protein
MWVVELHEGNEIELHGNEEVFLDVGFARWRCGFCNRRRTGCLG